MKTLLKLSLAATAVITAFGAQAQEFPSKDKTVTLVVPYAAGGPTDRVARDLAEALRKPLGGVSVVVDNAAGAGSTIGTAKAARATPDGYTLLLNHISMSTMPTMYRKLAFNVVNDFEYLGIINDVPHDADRQAQHGGQQLQGTVHLDQPEQGQDQPGQCRPGLCLAPVRPDVPKRPADRHDACALQGHGPAITDLIGGQIDLLCDQTTNTTSQIQIEARRSRPTP